MARKTHDLTVKTGEYTNAAGETKARYENVGSVMLADDGREFLLLKRTFSPAGVPNPDGRDTLIISKFEVREGDGQTQPPVSAQAYAKAKGREYAGHPQAPVMNDEIPF